MAERPLVLPPADCAGWSWIIQPDASRTPFRDDRMSSDIEDYSRPLLTKSITVAFKTCLTKSSKRNETRKTQNSCIEKNLGMPLTPWMCSG